MIDIKEIDVLDFNGSELLVGLSLGFVSLASMPISLNTIFLDTLGIYDSYVYLAILFLAGLFSMLLPVRKTANISSGLRSFTLVIIMEVFACIIFAYFVISEPFWALNYVYAVLIFLATLATGGFSGYLISRKLFTE